MEMNETFQQIAETMHELGVEENEVLRFINRCKMNVIKTDIRNLEEELKKLEKLEKELV